jgi:ribosomal protein S18 acetylase RimI-like enzyme
MNGNEPVEVWRATPGAEARVKAAEHLFDDPVDLGATERFLGDERNHLLIAYADGQPAGYVSGTELLHPDQPRPELFLNELGVDAAYRGRGIGRTLVAELWQLAQSRGCRGMWVLTDDENVAATKMYAVAGGTHKGANVMFQWGET